MALPWFPFYLDAYTGDTMHLTTEEHGAYLLLMIAYYRTQKPLPASDRALASICKLPMDRWMEAKPALAGFFTVSPSEWVHERIRAEILEASEKHAQSIARAEAGAAARWGKSSSKDASSKPVASSKDAKSKKNARSNPQGNAQSMPPASVEQSSKDAHIQEHILVGGGRRAGAREPVPEPLDSQPADLAGIEDALDGSHDDDIGLPVDLWKPVPGVSFDPQNAEQVALLNKFAKLHVEEGTLSRDWPTLWRKYLDDAEAAARPKRAPPRVETNKRPEQPPGRRVTISDDAKAAASQIEQICNIEHHPVTVGLPLLVETWLTTWPKELIVQVITDVMRMRAEKNEGPPRTMKYFETPIARAFEEAKRPITAAKPQGTSAHDRRHANSASNAARRLAEKLAAGDEGEPGNGSGQVRQIAGPVPAE